MDEHQGAVDALIQAEKGVRPEQRNWNPCEEIEDLRVVTFEAEERAQSAQSTIDQLRVETEEMDSARSELNPPNRISFSSGKRLKNPNFNSNKAKMNGLTKKRS